MDFPTVPDVFKEGMVVGDQLNILERKSRIEKIELVVTTKVIDLDDPDFGQEVKVTIPRKTFTRE